jgi:hypothetical protein
MASFAPGDIATEIGQFIVDGGEVVTEIATTHAGRRSCIAEVFSTQRGLITKLSCYIAGSARTSPSRRPATLSFVVSSTGLALTP